MDAMTPLSIWTVMIIGLVIGAITAYMANKRGRDPMIWFMMGALLGILGLILLFILPQLKEKESLSENGPEDALYNQSFQTGLKALPNQPAEIELSLRECKTKEWFYLDKEHESKGPVTFSDLKQVWEVGQINEATFVWYEGLADWRKISSITCLAELLAEPAVEQPQELD